MVENVGCDFNDKVFEYMLILSSNGKEIYFVIFDVDDVIYVDEENMEEIYVMIYCFILDDIDWLKFQELGGEINCFGFYNSNVCLFLDGSIMYFICVKLQGNIVFESKIYFSKGGGDFWLGVLELKGVNGDYIVKYFILGELYGKCVFFFVFDMEGGYGGFDLYYVIFIGEGEYSVLVNMGDVINIFGDEEIFYYWEGMFYFVFIGYFGLGGFDYFYFIWDGEKWSLVLNMGCGYNISVDDYGFMLDEEGYFGVFIFNCFGGCFVYGCICCDDIYMVNIVCIVVDLMVGIFMVDKKLLISSIVYLVFMINDKMGILNV